MKIDPTITTSVGCLKCALLAKRLHLYFTTPLSLYLHPQRRVRTFPLFPLHLSGFPGEIPIWVPASSIGFRA
ncbi:hypothetical protein M5689_004712 [Euphorbia peplus]|nr:hypothetical protein M5689_004712 [Euphorbia peplus]